MTACEVPKVRSGWDTRPTLLVYCPAAVHARAACKNFGGNPARYLIPFRVLCVAVSKYRDFLEGARIRGGPPTGFWRYLKKYFGHPNCPKSYLAH